MAKKKSSKDLYKQEGQTEHGLGFLGKLRNSKRTVKQEKIDYKDRSSDENIQESPKEDPKSKVEDEKQQENSGADLKGMKKTEPENVPANEENQKESDSDLEQFANLDIFGNQALGCLAEHLPGNVTSSESIQGDSQEDSEVENPSRAAEEAVRSSKYLDNAEIEDIKNMELSILISQILRYVPYDQEPNTQCRFLVERAIKVAKDNENGYQKTINCLMRFTERLLNKLFCPAEDDPEKTDKEGCKDLSQKIQERILGSNAKELFSKEFNNNLFRDFSEEERDDHRSKTMEHILEQAVKASVPEGRTQCHILKAVAPKLKKKGKKANLSRSKFKRVKKQFNKFKKFNKDKWSKMDEGVKKREKKTLYKILEDIYDGRVYEGSESSNISEPQVQWGQIGDRKVELGKESVESFDHYKGEEEEQHEQIVLKLEDDQPKVKQQVSSPKNEKAVKKETKEEEKEAQAEEEVNDMKKAKKAKKEKSKKHKRNKKDKKNKKNKKSKKHKKHKKDDEEDDGEGGSNPQKDIADKEEIGPGAPTPTTETAK